MSSPLTTEKLVLAMIAVVVISLLGLVAVAVLSKSAPKSIVVEKKLFEYLGSESGALGWTVRAYDFTDPKTGERVLLFQTVEGGITAMPAGVPNIFPEVDAKPKAEQEH